MHVLVTGSSGEIGTNLALKLLESEHSVRGIDKRKNTWTGAFPYDIQDLRTAIANTEKFDLVVHLAANAKVHELVENPERALDNITITFNVLEFCRAHKLPIVFSSSREVYGDIHRYITNEKQSDFHFTESPYSASKIAGEALIYSYARCYGIPYLVFRFSNVYGRYDSDIDRMERVIPLFIQKVSQGKPIVVYGKDKTLDFTYVDDCVAGVMLGIEKMLSGKIKNETINLAYGEGHTLVELVELISAELGKNPDVRIEPSKIGEVTHYVADIAKARELLGYSPKTNLKEGIKKAIAWQNSFQS